MRIAVIGPIYPDSFAKCICHSLRGMGHEVLSVNPGIAAGPIYEVDLLKIKSLEAAVSRSHPSLEALFWRKAVAQVQSFHPGIILTAIWDIPPAILEKFKQRSGRELVTVMWCPDPLTSFHRQYLFVAPYDYLFFKDQYIVDFCRKKLDLPAFLLPLACCPEWHQKVTLTPEEQRVYGCDIATAASLYNYRLKFLENFSQYQMKIWGPPPSNYLRSPILKFVQGRYVGELEKAKAFNGAAIVLNNQHYGEILGINQRVFDACGCGAFQIVDASPVMADYFVSGKELVCFQDLQDLQELIPYYLNRPRERAEIAYAGYVRAHAEHTFRHRLETMLQIIAGNAPESGQVRGSGDNFRGPA